MLSHLSFFLYLACCSVYIQADGIDTHIQSGNAAREYALSYLLALGHFNESKLQNTSTNATPTESNTNDCFKPGFNCNQVGGLYSGDMMGKRKREDIIQQAFGGPNDVFQSPLFGQPGQRPAGNVVQQAFGQYTGTMRGKRFAFPTPFGGNVVQQAYGKYTGNMYGKRSSKSTTVKRYGDNVVQQAFGQYTGGSSSGSSGGSYGNRPSATNLVQQSFGKYTGDMLGKRFAFLNGFGGDNVVQQAFGQYTGKMYGKRATTTNSKRDENPVQQSFGKYDDKLLESVGEKPV